MCLFYEAAGFSFFRRSQVFSASEKHAILDGDNVLFRTEFVSVRGLKGLG
ncbi:hypothetical protein HMPREF9374_0729 [Desmospora sp. 8437]|nr:hypothetical protein HMPREF9374_0729 [Desmospora sp. 8437]